MENQNYIFHASVFFLLEDTVDSLQQYMDVNEAGQQQTNDAAISYSNLYLQLWMYNIIRRVLIPTHCLHVCGNVQ